MFFIFFLGMFLFFFGLALPDEEETRDAGFESTG